MGFTLLALIFIAIVFALLLALPKSAARSFLESHPYYSKNPLTPTEAIFYELLVQALPEHVVLAQVQLSRFIDIDRYKIQGDKYRWLNPILQQSVDYLICDKSFKIVAAIELDDKTHDTEDARRRDSKKNRNVAAAGINLIRWHAELLPTADEIREKVLAARAYAGETEKTQDDWFRPTVESLLTQLLRAYLKRSNPLPLLVAKGAFLLIFAGLFTWALTNLFDTVVHAARRSQPPVLTSTAQPHAVTDQQQQLVERQTAEMQLKEQQQKAAREATLNQERAKLDDMLLASREAALKEELWSWYYKKEPKCEANYDSDCANAFIRAKRKFDEQWNSGMRERGRFVR